MKHFDACNHDEGVTPYYDHVVCQTCSAFKPDALRSGGMNLLGDELWFKSEHDFETFKQTGLRYKKEPMIALRAAEYRALLALLMCADPWPLEPEYEQVLKDFADNAASTVGCNNWVDAYMVLFSGRGAAK
jgi:hypothetical protein